MSLLICAYRDGSLVNAPESSWLLTPLHLACWDSNKEVVELLLEAEANQDARCTHTLSKFLPIKNFVVLGTLRTDSMASGVIFE